MLNPLTVIGIFCVYMCLLFLAGIWTERRARTRGRSWANNPLVYSLALAVYCSSWTYYGSVGQAATSGPLFLATYLGATLSVILWWTVLRKLVRIKSNHRITSIADFISARYDRSPGLAALVTLGVLLGTTPYIALQLKSVFSTFALILPDVPSSWATRLIKYNVGPLVIMLMSIFTIVFGVRRVDPTERHEGMVMAMALKSLVKLLAFLAVGIFVTYFLYDGFGDIFHRLSESPYRRHISFGGHDTTYATWMSFLVLAMSAILFLPRQFHVAVVENSDEKHILTAMWLFPLYLLLINIFVIPIAMGGLLRGLGVEQADSFVLLLPLQSGHSILTLLVFIGGFSAATGMVMISAMTLATMVTNHLLLPVVEWCRWLGFLRRHILECRWIVVTGCILVGYWFERQIGQSYMLVRIGIIAFAAALQFAPCILAGIFWKRANKPGATWGLCAGMMVWFYTLLLPSLIKSGWLSTDLLREGLWGFSFLRPEQLFGVTALDPVSHCVFWSMFFNIGLLVFGSLYFRQSEEESHLAASFVGALATMEQLSLFKPAGSTVNLQAKKTKILEVLFEYFSLKEGEAIFDRCAAAAGLQNKKRVSIAELSRLVSEVEKALAGSFGAATAHRVITHANIYTSAEAENLTEIYRKILARMHIGPEQLKEKVDFYQERERLLTHHAKELEEKVEQRDREIAERKRAEQALRESELKYRTLFESAPVGIGLATADGQILAYNDAMVQITGYSQGELEQIDVRDLYVNPEERVSLLQKLERDGFARDFELRLRRRDGQPCYASLTMNRFTLGGKDILLTLCQDITTHKQAEEERERFRAQMHQVQRLEALGTLAGGIAHDFNNLLMGIQGNISLMLLRRDPSDPDYARLKNIERQVESGAKLTGRLLGYVGKGKYEVKAFSLNQLVEETADTFSRMRKEITIHSDLAENLLAIIADREQIEQVLLNLYLNAADAMPGGGHLILKTINQTHEDMKDRSYKPKPGRYVLLTVTDRGIGMDKETMEHIFDPFFTTKELGRGTGLGLASAYGIVKSHNGFIDVESQIGQGTTFRVYLPATEKKAARLARAPEQLIRGSGTVLLVEDEESIRQIGQELLQVMGYTVLTATDGKEAIKVYRNHHDHINLVLLDMIMPNMGGKETFARLKEINPEVRVLLLSGYSQDGQATEMLEQGCNGFIQKPFNIDELSKKIKEVLEEG